MYFILPTGQLTNNDVGKFKTLVIFDCRGVEPVDFEPKSGWIAKAEDDGKHRQINFRQTVVVAISINLSFFC